MKSSTSSRAVAARTTRTVGFAAVALAFSSVAALAQNVVVQGNRRVDAETIRSYAGSGDPQAIRQQLLGTGLFSSVNVAQRGNQTVIKVVENRAAPAATAGSVNRVAFEGNKRLKGDFLRGEVQSRDRGQIIQSVIDADIAKVRELYRRAGYGLSSVTARIVPLENGRSDIVFTVVESGKTGIRSINFSGNNVYSSSRLRGQMSSTEMNFLSWLKTTDVYDPDRIASDLELVRRFYLKNGYADFRVVSNTARFDETAGGYILDIVISEGQPYQLSDVRIDSSLRDLDSAALQRLVTTSAGDTYNAEAVEKSILVLTTEINRRGYPFAQVRPAGQRIAGTNGIGLTYVVEEGPRVYVERINIRGNTRTRDYVVRRELDIGEGDAYNRVLVNRAERRLNNLGFFEKVRITNEPGSAADRVIVNVDVEDKATGSFSVAGGYSTSDGVIGEVSLSESNFLGRGQFVRIAGTTGQRTKGIDFSFTEPYFLGYRLAAGFDIFSKFSDNSNTSRFESRVTGGQIRFTLPVTEEFSITPRYSIYTTNIKIPNTVSRPYDDCSVGQAITGITVIDGINNCVANGEASVAVKEARGETLTSLAGINFNYNSLDSIQKPKNGLVVELKPEFAGIGGDSRFFRVTADARYYRELYDDVVGIVRAQGGHILSFGGPTRMIDHFFLGPTLVRGFASSGLGPRDLATDPRTGALGGTTYFGGSLEVQFPIVGLPRELGLKGAVFADAGTLFNYDGGFASGFAGCQTGTSARQFNVAVTAPQSNVACVRDKNILRSSVGASLLWDSPLGPIRFDYAYALSRDKGVGGIGGDRLQGFRFSGGARF